MSPYENRTRSDKICRFGLISFLGPDAAAESTAPIEAPHQAVVARWATLGLHNVSLFHDFTLEKNPVFLYLEFNENNATEVVRLVQSDAWFQALSPRLIPHVRAAVGTDWMPMEMINLIGPTLPLPTDAEQLSRAGLVVRLKPEMELIYRTLHQTNWPGVVEQMRRSNRRYWVTFLIEEGDDLWLYTYSEYVGQNVAADDALMAADPVTQRWWKHTEPCLQSVRPGHSTWAPLHAVCK
jgi:L-rhamnose mutarotase